MFKRAKKGVISLLVALCLSQVVMLTQSKVVDASSNQTQVYNCLIDAGFSKASAYGILANIKYESTFRPNVGSVNYGLCQWSGSRKRRLISYCKKHKLNYKSIKGQISYLTYELKTYYKKVYNKIKNVPNTKQGAYKAAYTFCYSFECPRNKGKKAKQRGNLAKKYFH